MKADRDDDWLSTDSPNFFECLFFSMSFSCVQCCVMLFLVFFFLSMPWLEFYVHKNLRIFFLYSLFFLVVKEKEKREGEKFFSCCVSCIKEMREKYNFNDINLPFTTVKSDIIWVEWSVMSYILYIFRKIINDKNFNSIYFTWFSVLWLNKCSQDSLEWFKRTQINQQQTPCGWTLINFYFNISQHNVLFSQISHIFFLCIGFNSLLHNISLFLILFLYFIRVSQASRQSNFETRRVCMLFDKVLNSNAVSLKRTNKSIE